MKLSDISTLALSPGRYRIVATFDGDDSLNPVQAQYILTVNAVSSSSQSGRPVTDDNEDGQKPTIVKRDPDFYFSSNTVYYNELETGNYTFDFTGYLVNNDGVGYSISLSEGIYIETDGNIGWYDSGTYTITLTSNSTEVFNSKVITMTLNITSKLNPQIEYHNDGTFVLQDGVLIKKYYNLEKRDGVYKFDLTQPTNPYSLPLEYKIEGKSNCYIDVDNNKVYVSREGRYKVTATFVGNNTYRPSITSYILSYYENAENEANDNQGTLFGKQSPNLSFSSNTINVTTNANGTYSGQQVNNPFGVSGVWSTSNNANITANGSTITFNGTGNVIVYYSFYGNDKYISQTVSYVLHVYDQENADGKPLPNISFTNSIVTVEENDKHEYYIQQVNNPNSVNVRYYCNDKQITDGIFRTDRVGRFVITARTEENDTFYSTSTSYTLVITARDKTIPTIWFLNDNETVSKTPDNTYLIQLANCSVDVPITYTVSSGTLQDRVLTHTGAGMVVITATTEKTFNYESVSASYVLTIKEGNKLSPGIYFKDPYYGKATYDNENQSQSNIYDIYELYNPHNVAVRFYTDRGNLDNETNAKKLDMSNESDKKGTINIYAQSIEDDTYMSEIATYKLVISDTTELDIDYSGDVSPDGPYGLRLDLYAKGKLNTPVLIEILRFPKDPNFTFSRDEWYITPFSSDHEVNDLIYSEDGNESVISARITFFKFGSFYLEFRFDGNEKFNETKRTFLTIHFDNQQKSPEISFSSYKVIVEQTEDYKYVLQAPENPHNLDIVYWTSLHGEVTGNILYLEGTLSLTIFAKNIETDDYYSQTIRYDMIIQKREKPSRGWHFATSADDDTPIPMHQNNRYVVRDIVDANGNLVPISELTGRFKCSWASNFAYDEDLGKYIVTLTNEPAMMNAFDRDGVLHFTVSYDLDETETYKKETLTYTQYVKDKQRANISFNEDPVNLKEVEDQRYRIQTLNNPDNYPITWTCEGDGHFDDPNDPKYIIINRRGNSWTKIYATVAETDSVKETTAIYNLYTLAVTQWGPGWDWSMKWKDEYLFDPSNEDSKTGYVDPNDTGVYDLWNMLELIGGWTWDNVDRIVITSGSYKVSENRYFILDTEVENPYNPDISARVINFEIWSKEDFEHTSGVWRLSLVVKYPYMRYLFENNNTRIWYEAEFTSEVNEEHELEFGRWPIDPDFVFNADEWTVSPYGFETIKNLYTKEVNGYTVLCGTFSTTKLNTYLDGQIKFSGNNIFYPCYISYDIYVSKVKEPEDTRLIPKLDFDDYYVDVLQTANDQYLLQTLKKPDDCEIDRWEAEGEYGIIPTIIDDTYVYYPIGDISDGAHRSVHLTVYTKESDIYKPYSIGYHLYVRKSWKSGSGIKFKYSSKSSNKNDQYQYELPTLENPYDLPVTWSTSAGTIENGYLIYDGVGTVTITVTFDGDDTYKAITTTCEYKINDAYDKQYLTYIEGDDILGMQVVFGEEYSFEILRWPIAIGLEFNENEWRCSWDGYATSSFTGLYSVDEGEYRVLMGKFIPNKTGSSYISTTFKGNDHFYQKYHIADFTVSWTRPVDLIDPEISFTESTVTMAHSDTHKYLIQTPNGAAGVTFDAPTTSLGYIEKVDDDYYVVYDGNDEASITISIKSVQDSTYYQQTISYTLNVEAKPVVVEDTQISFANPEVTMDYIWETNKTKRYKIQDLYNPWGLNVDYTITAGNLREEDDGYYIYYDTVGDITITVVGQSNQYYNGSTASYTMHIVSIGEDFTMTFEQPTITVTQTSEGRYLLQQVTLNPEVSNIRDNIVYSAVGATIEASGDDFYIVYDGTGNLRVKALFESDNYYKSKEAYYTLTIEEDIQMVAPDISISSSNIKVENISEQTSFKVPTVTNNSGVEYNWYIGNTQLVVDENGYFNYDATGDFVVTLKTVGTQQYNSIQLYCNYTNIEDPDISISSNNFKFENISEQTSFKVPTVTNNSGVEYAWYIGDTQLAVDANGYFNYDATGDFVVTLKTVETQQYNSIQLYCEYTNIENPDINISTKRVRIINLNENNRFKVPTVTNNSGVEYAWYIGDTQLVVDSNGYFNYDATGDFVIYLETVESQHYYSIRLYCEYTNVGYEGQYLTIESLEDNNDIGWRIAVNNEYDYDGKTIEYSIDGVNWTNIKSTNQGANMCTLNEGDKVYIKSDNFYGLRSRFTSTKAINVSGNIMSLLYRDNFDNISSIEYPFKTNNWDWTSANNQNFNSLFARATNLINAGNLILPAKSLYYSGSDGCYASMFWGCTSLTTPPALPATQLSTYCYSGMFAGCTSLTTAPALPATDAIGYCYYGMFEGCTSLVNAPELPATMLGDYCYREMFKDCKSLVNAPELPAQDVGQNRATNIMGCYYGMFECCTSLVNAPELPATILGHWCYERMFYGCTSLVNAPELPATILYNGDRCYCSMFEGCTSLTTAPELPATHLKASCYWRMFKDCTSLSSVRILATDISASDCLTNWLNGVPSSGTFTKKSSVEYPVGESGIPEGWTVVNI